MEMARDNPRKSILVVDDEEIVRRCCERTLQPAGYDVETAGQGEDGFSMLISKTYDLLITDLKMPRMDGLELMGRAREARPLMKVIIMTGYITAGTREAVLKAGAFRCVEKPFRPDDLLGAVTEAMT